jgi:hypothetical protein
MEIVSLSTVKKRKKDQISKVLSHWEKFNGFWILKERLIVVREINKQWFPGKQL